MLHVVGLLRCGAAPQGARVPLFESPVEGIYERISAFLGERPRSGRSRALYERQTWGRTEGGGGEAPPAAAGSLAAVGMRRDIQQSLVRARKRRVRCHPMLHAFRCVPIAGPQLSVPGVGFAQGEHFMANGIRLARGAGKSVLLGRGDVGGLSLALQPVL